MLTLYLHGPLRGYGGPFRLAVTTAADAVRALCVQHPALADRLCYRHLRLISGAYRTGTSLSLPACYHRLDHSHLHLVPVHSGAGRSDGKLVLGMTLLGLSVLPGVTAGPLAGLGASAASAPDLLLRQLLGSAGAFALRAALSARNDAQPAAYGAADAASSDLITAPGGTAEGRPVPLVYGRVRLTAPPVISSSLVVEARSL